VEKENELKRMGGHQNKKSEKKIPLKTHSQHEKRRREQRRGRYSSRGRKDLCAKKKNCFGYGWVRGNMTSLRKSPGSRPRFLPKINSDKSGVAVEKTKGISTHLYGIMEAFHEQPRKTVKPEASALGRHNGGKSTKTTVPPEKQGKPYINTSSLMRQKKALLEKRPITPNVNGGSASLTLVPAGGGKVGTERTSVLANSMS